MREEGDDAAPEAEAEVLDLVPDFREELPEGEDLGAVPEVAVDVADIQRC